MAAAVGATRASTAGRQQRPGGSCRRQITVVCAVRGANSRCVAKVQAAVGVEWKWTAAPEPSHASLTTQTTMMEPCSGSSEGQAPPPSLRQRLAAAAAVAALLVASPAGAAEEAAASALGDVTPVYFGNGEGCAARCVEGRWCCLCMGSGGTEARPRPAPPSPTPLIPLWSALHGVSLRA